MESRVRKRLLSYVGRFGDWSLYAFAGLAAIFLSLMVVLVTVDVILREFGHTTGVAVEISGYSLAGILFMGFAYTLRKGRHIRIRVVTDRLPERIRQWLYIGNLIIALGLAVWFLWYTGQYVIGAYNLKSVSMTPLRTPLWMVQSMMPIGFSLFAAAVTAEIVKTVRLIIQRRT